MAYKLITTKVAGHLVSVLLDEKERFIEVHPFAEGQQSMVGNIYVGQVKNVKKNINSAFVDIGHGDNVYVSLGESRHIYYARKVGTGDKVVQGDEILVQIQKDAHKTKLAKAVTDFSLTGRYLVLTTDKSAVYISSKITDDKKRLALKHMLRKHLSKEFGIIARTNCQDAEDSILLEELISLKSQYDSILSVLKYRSKGHRLHTQGQPYMTILKEFYDHEVDTFLYDNQVIYDEVKAFAAENYPELKAKIALSDGPQTFDLTLNLKGKVEKLLRQKVWLKSGASIIIEPTEALTVIDVNTERSLSKKNIEETVLRTNLEAAESLMYQLRARNISGIIIVDFIDMTRDEDKERLLKLMEDLASKDPQKTIVIGMTALGLVEMTRKKRKPTLKEQWAVLNLDTD